MRQIKCRTSSDPIVLDPIVLLDRTHAIHWDLHNQTFYEKRDIIILSYNDNVEHAQSPPVSSSFSASDFCMKAPT
jgi:hypothetical protein